ncbi:Stp1/IreP family PP2C-type Ser/Thr phosphatase [Neobacillus sp. MM2021_6]|uniref:Stp1/IreP family PP2C-type Ser/Thr phosphatase n=1 Tax=Bacillaceae TaxID=186817 RepID=UPI00140B3DB3|nr:Stp1/IreP family PP2C-type Ser/Thr phosphatase [Neobacillus sp. OS1-2]MBO0959160.1 Stp1/IreP family PP2C-type Ser/Thr phosphatase [Neobacillus sp. MM2021_6]NHC16921.1 Stp1/IreP family PP2C-type Ser/Thr phosphatase [Bacillus sp. MM2020_4]WML42343.1 Stp1/IreP family PP2C-type Ser/Thr phosphatase [Neobacillus sp. OS1-2]
MKAVFKTDQGRVRQNNEDSGGTFVNKDGYRLAIVADGMGGHRAGDVASKMSVTHLQESWEQTEGIITADDAEKWLRTQIFEVNQLVFDHANNNVECDGMGTTIEAVIATNHFATIAHVGDSRCYIFNDSGFQQLTEDHTLVNELVRTGQITKEDAEHHPRKNVILRAIGTEQDVKIDTKTIIFEEGDILLLCSDGLSNKVKEEQMISILQSEDSLEQKALSLINGANENGGEDNITLIILEFDDDSERG